MAKLTKEKFHLTGKYEEARTTYTSKIELYLHYDTAHDFFYFEHKEYGKFLLNKDASLDFGKCKTRDDAMKLMSVAIYGDAEIKRFLRIILHFEGSLGLKKDKLNVPLQEMIKWGDFFKSEKRELGLEFERILRFGNEENRYAYVRCENDWTYNSKHNHFSSYGDNLIEWDEETENFIIKMQKAIDEISLKVISFFNTKDVLELKERIKQTPSLITDKKDETPDKKRGS